jgi:TolB protein
MFKLFIICLNFIVCSLAFADADVTVVAVGQAELDKDKISINIIENTQLGASNKRIAEESISIIQNDLGFYKYHYDITSNKQADGKINLAGLKEKNINYLIELSSFERNAQEQRGADLFISARVVNLRNEKELFNENFLFKTPMRLFSHRIADAIYKSISNKESIFLSKMVFVSDKGSTASKTIKELYMVDFDGFNLEKLTNHRSIVISPGISSDGKKIIYSLITMKRGVQNVDLFMYDLVNKTSQLISAKNGINSGAIFADNDQSIYLTLSYTGNSDIYKMDLASKELTKVTSHYADEVDPSLSKDGKLMAFLSNRPGPAMIYTLDPRGVEKNVKRISYVGKFNATPRFSPDGLEIAFASWVDNRFDIYRIGSNGNGLVRLTKNFGSNEDPSYSNDGQFIAFASQRVLSPKKAIQNIYIMTRDGEILGSITKDFGNCSSARWSNSLNF